MKICPLVTQIASDDVHTMLVTSIRLGWSPIEILDELTWKVIIANQCCQLYRARHENIYKLTNKNNNKSVKIFAPRRVGKIIHIWVLKRILYILGNVIFSALRKYFSFTETFSRRLLFLHYKNGKKWRAAHFFCWKNLWKLALCKKSDDVTTKSKASRRLLCTDKWNGISFLEKICMSVSLPVLPTFEKNWNLILEAFTFICKIKH